MDQLDEALRWAVKLVITGYIWIKPVLTGLTDIICLVFDVFSRFKLLFAGFLPLPFSNYFFWILELGHGLFP